MLLLPVATILASVLSFVQAQSNVIDLTPANFDTVIGKGKPALVEFFAPWCGHCKNLAPVYEELANAYSHAPDVIIAKVDADAEKELGGRFGVKGFPTLKWFNKDGSPEDYNGGRTLTELAEFVTKKSGIKSKIKPPPPPATTQLNYLTYEEADPTKDVLVAFTASWCGHCKTMKPIYEQIAKNFKPEADVVIANYECDSEANKPLAMKLGIESFPTIKFYPKGSDKKTPILYEEGRNEKEFTDWLNEHCGTQRAVGGGLNGLAGRISKLDELAQKFFAAAPTSRRAIYESATQLSDAAAGYGAIYIRSMERVLNGTTDYFQKEGKRLASILEKRKLSDEKLDMLKIKANIIAAFVEKKAEDVVEDIVEDVKWLKEEL